MQHLPQKEWRALHSADRQHRMVVSALVDTAKVHVSELVSTAHDRTFTQAFPNLSYITVLLDNSSPAAIRTAMQQIFPAAPHNVRQPCSITFHTTRQLNFSTRSTAAEIAADVATTAGYSQDTCLWEPDLSQQAARALLNAFRCPRLSIYLEPATVPRTLQLASRHLSSLQALAVRCYSNHRPTYTWVDSAAATSLTSISVDSVTLRMPRLPGLQEAALHNSYMDPRPSSVTTSRHITKWRCTGFGSGSSADVARAAVAELAALPLQALHVNHLLLQPGTVFHTLSALQVCAACDLQVSLLCS